MSSQTIQSYLSNIIETQQCKPQILQRMKIVKSKIDLMENQEKLKHEEHVHVFIHRFKKDLKFLLGQFQLFKNVVNKLEKENYARFSQSTQMLIKVIRQQVTRFHNLIPEDIQEKVNVSRLRGASMGSKIKPKQQSSPTQIMSHAAQGEKEVDNSVNNKDKVEQKAQKFQKEDEKLPSIALTKQTSMQQNEQIIKDLQNFLISEDEQRQSKEQSQESETQPFIEQAQNMILKQSHESIIPQQLQEQHKQQRKRYARFLQSERIKSQRRPLKIAGKILLCLLIVALIILTILLFGLYKLAKIIAGTSQL